MSTKLSLPEINKEIDKKEAQDKAKKELLKRNKNIDKEIKK